MSQSPPDFFTQELALAYDERNRRLSPISDNMHFLIRLVLQELPVHSRVLCVGVGTGAEIFSLAHAFPEWKFVGVDPSASMLAVCAERLKKAGLWDRCELVHGYIHDVTAVESFDGVLGVLVGHFVRHEDRLGFYQNMTARLKKGGVFINTEISYDLNSDKFPSMLKNWEQIQARMGATPESLANLPKQLREFLTILSNDEVEELMSQCALEIPIKFFQAFMISGWHARKV